MNVLDQIELTRKKMIEAGILFGYTARETLTLSQELDQLLNKLGAKKS